MNKRKKQALSIGVILLLCAAACLLFVNRGKTGTESYAEAENWACFPEEIDFDTDVFFIAPTVYMGAEGQYNMSLSDEDTKASFLGATNMEKGIYDEECNFYAPYYKQKALSIYELPETEQGTYTEIAYADVKEAFLYYLDNYNEGRPIILAGFSQGSEMALLLLEDCFADRELQTQLVAAYLPGWRVTEEDLQNYPQLKMAEAEADTGCIICFNSESPAVTSSVIVPEKTYGINPLNWMCDSTPAEKALNMGACFTDYGGNIKSEIPKLCGAYLDEERGTLKITDINPEDYPPVLSLFEPGVYHLYDYQFFYRNLQANVKTRARQYRVLNGIKNDKARAAISSFWTDCKLENEEDTEKYTGVRMSANVTAQMLSADYWINKTDGLDGVVLTEQEIEALNLRNQKSKRETDYAALSSAEGLKALSGEEVLEILSQLGIPEGDSFLNGEAVDAEYWEQVLSEENLDRISDVNQIRYGYSVKRGDVRILPTADLLYESEEDYLTDRLQNSSILLNEPVIVIYTNQSGKWMYVLTNYCEGWVQSSSVALCSSKDEWLALQKPEKFLMITEDAIYLDQNPANPALSGLALSMGTKLALVTDGSGKQAADYREPFDSWAVQIPVRTETGQLDFETGFIPCAESVSLGYLPYTRENVIRLAFASHGRRYGWGGMYGARDCSQFIMEIYRCFGILTARNTGGQAAMNSKMLSLKGMSKESKEKLLKRISPGTELFFPGHVMIYLGEENGQYYVISALGSMRPENSESDEVTAVHTVTVNDLNVTRRNGKSWIESLEKIILIK